MAKSEVEKVSVPQDSGTITLTQGGESREFTVSNGTVSPKTQEEQDALLASVPGAKTVSAEKAESKE